MFFPKKMLPVGNGMFKEIISHQIDSGKKMNFHWYFRVSMLSQTWSVRVNEWWNGIDFV